MTTTTTIKVPQAPRFIVSFGTGIFLLVLSLVLLSFWFGFLHGKAQTQLKWDEARKQHAAKMLEEERNVAKKEKELLGNIAALEAEIKNAKQTHRKNITAIRSSYDERLRGAEARARRYEHLSKGSDADRRNLADHTAELDRTLEEGRYLVRELGETLRQRDEEITQIGDYLNTVIQKVNEDSPSAK